MGSYQFRLRQQHQRTVSPEIYNKFVRQGSMQAKNRSFMKKYIVFMLSFTALLLLVFSSSGLAPMKALALNVRGASPNRLLFSDDFSHGSRRWSPQLGMWKVCPGSIDKTEYC